jgi:uncharacterized protein (TIGR00730 family)
MQIKQHDERKFFEGPQSRVEEGSFMFKVLLQFIKGFRTFHFIGPCITVFGSARFDENHIYYKQAREIGKEVAKMGFTIMTGGGPGIMEAANRGAKESGGRSVGCNIVLSHEQKPNAYLDHWVNIKYFFVRKVLLTKYSHAFVVMPGGYGTLDEFFESITLMQTNKMSRFPVVLIGKQFHKALYDHLKSLITAGTISASDIELFLFTDDTKEALDYIKKHTGEKAPKALKHKPLWWLGERFIKVK